MQFNKRNYGSEIKNLLLDDHTHINMVNQRLLRRLTAVLLDKLGPGRSWSRAKHLLDVYVISDFNKY